MFFCSVSLAFYLMEFSSGRMEFTHVFSVSFLPCFGRGQSLIIVCSSTDVNKKDLSSSWFSQASLSESRVHMCAVRLYHPSLCLREPRTHVCCAPTHHTLLLSQASEQKISSPAHTEGVGGIAETRGCAFTMRQQAAETDTSVPRPSLPVQRPLAACHIRVTEPLPASD